MPLLSTGYEVQTLADIRAELDADARARISATLDVSDFSVAGKLLGIVAERERALQLQMRDVWQSYRAEGASGVSLKSLCALTGTIARVAEASTVELSFTLAAGVSVAAGSQFRVPGDTVTVWQIAVDLENVTASPITVLTTATATATGPRAAGAGTVTEFLAPVIGATVTNPADAILGQDEETDSELRARREVELRSAGASAIDAIVSDVREVAGVVSAVGSENDTDATVGALPPHSFRVVAYGTATDDALAQAIWDNKPAGIPSVGTDSGTATDRFGATHTVSFERASQLLTYVDVQVRYNSETWTSLAAMQAAVKAALVAASAGWDIAATVYRMSLAGPVFSVGGILDIPLLRIGTSAWPGTDADLTPSATQVPVLDVSRVRVTAV
jgi:Baseplate J-like protein